MPNGMTWHISHRADDRALPLADRHYSRQCPGSDQFVKPGRCLVLWQPEALWVTFWPFAEHVKHEWAGAWECSLFRNEGAGLSSDLIRQAVSATRWKYGDPPADGMITFIDQSEVQSEHPGYCYKCAGFESAGHTKGGLVAVQMHAKDMPDPAPPLGGQLQLNQPTRHKQTSV
jgi:hypothetical protein